jgi:hypothetical protein
MIALAFLTGHPLFFFLAGNQGSNEWEDTSPSWFNGIEFSKVIHMVRTQKGYRHASMFHLNIYFSAFTG